MVNYRKSINASATSFIAQGSANLAC